MAADHDDHNKKQDRPQGLKGLWGGLISKKPAGEEDDFHPATAPIPRAPSPRMQGAQAPSRTVVAAAASAPKGGEEPPAYFQRYQPAPREVPESRMLIRGSKLYELYCRMNGTKPFAKAGASFSLSLFMPQGLQPDAEQRTWLRTVERDVRAMPQYALPRPDPRHPEEAPEPFPVDAYAFVLVAHDGLTAYLFILSPLEGGQPLPREWVYRLLNEHGVDTGIDDGAITHACQQEVHMQLVPIAVGISPIPGEDGKIVDHFSREIEVQLKVQDDNTVDFKDLGWLQTVRKGEIICDILMPTRGTPGLTVQGKPVEAPDGAHVVAPAAPAPAWARTAPSCCPPWTACSPFWAAPSGWSPCSSSKGTWTTPSAIWT